MAIFENCALYFCRLDPKHPNSSFNKKNPTWEAQIRTSDVEQKKEWEEGNLYPKVIKYPDGHENEGEPILDDDGKKQWRVNLRKRSFNEKDNEPAAAVKVIDGDMNDVDPNSIGNGSIANVRVYQREYTNAENGKKGIASTLMAIQITKHVIYVPKPRDDDFKKTNTQRIEPSKNTKEDVDSTAEDDKF